MNELITFKKLWGNPPDVEGADHSPCRKTDGDSKFDNQCAIRVGVALIKSGVSTSRLRGINHEGKMANLAHCWGEGHAKSLGHTFRAEDLARALEHTYIQGINKVEKINAKDFNKKLLGKTGIIFFKDYWQREPGGIKETFRNRSGDHIDLWNGNRLTSLSSWARIHLRVAGFGLHSISDRWSNYEDSKAIWFWAVN